MKKTFREVIRDIKEGEVWESLNTIRGIIIEKDITGITIKDKKGNAYVWFCDKWIFNLKRKEYTFEEAWKAYEEGKEIESVKYRYKKIEGRDCWYCESDGFWHIESNGFNIGISEIRNKWYIND